MSQPAIEVSGLSKRYVIQHESQHDNLRDQLHHTARKLWRRFRWGTGFQSEEFWALRDVSFAIQPGEVVGIIGRNGAGKSTLLKILSRITEPSSGKVSLRGRVASLLEVGTGFHPELSGRDNIFLNGAILGMRRAEIRKKFDEIVAFAEVERFLDTPVKRYSSGMYVRLAFAVAAHLDPEILIVDEVLAVGDQEFQKKCLGKMRNVARNEGRTVLVVSHNLNQIATLATKGILLQQGRTLMTGDMTDVIHRYFGSNTTTGSEYLADKPASEPHLRRISLRTSEPGNIQAYGKPLIAEFELHHPCAMKDACFSFQILNCAAQPAVHLWLYSSDVPYAQEPGKTLLRCEIPFTRLNVGPYSLRAFFSGPPGSPFFEMTEPGLSFEVVRLDQATLFGWRSDACTYFEDGRWTITPPSS